jgi:hypothetical protein
LTDKSVGEPCQARCLTYKSIIPVGAGILPAFRGDLSVNQGFKWYKKFLKSGAPRRFLKISWIPSQRKGLYWVFK